MLVRTPGKKSEGGASEIHFQTSYSSYFSLRWISKHLAKLNNEQNAEHEEMKEWI